MTQWHHLKPHKILTLEAIALLVGTIVGAGIFGLPYMFAKAGFLTGLVILIVLALSTVLINLLIGEMVLSSKNNEQLVGLSGKYGGQAGRWAMFVAIGLGLYGPLTAYIIGEGQVLNVLAGHSSPLLFSGIFFVFSSIFVYLGLDFLRRWELFFTGLLFLVIIALTVVHGSRISFAELAVFDWHKIFFSFGAIFFAFLGGSAIPPMRSILTGQESLLKKSIIIGTLIPAIIYIIFVGLVVGITGQGTTEIATVGLGSALGQSFLIIANIFTIFIMATSFLTLGTTLMLIYQDDLGFKKPLAWLVTCLPPFLLVLGGLHSFVMIISWVGGLTGGLVGFVLLWSYYRLRRYRLADRVSEYHLPFYPLIIAWLSLVFLGGLGYVFLTLF